MTQRQVFIISHFFPPLNEIASLRTYAFAKYLGEAYPVTIITSEKNPDDGLSDLHFNCETFKVVSIPYLPAFMRRKNMLTRLIKMFFVFQHRLGGIFDFKIIWARRAKQYFIKNYDPKVEYTVICSFSPVHSFLAGYWIKNKFPENVKLVFDYRDLWYRNPYVKVYKPFAYFQHKYEAKMLRVVDYVVTVSKGLAKELSGLYNTHVEIVQNGFFSEEVPVPVNKTTGPLSIVYTGYIYKSIRDPEPLFKAVKALMDEKYFAPGEIVIDFYGSQRELIDPIVQKLCLQDYVRVFKKVSRENVLEIQKNASCLLFLEWDDPRAYGVLPGKLFEYLVSGTQILSVGPDAGAESSILIEESKSGFVCGKDVDKIKTALKQIKANRNLMSPNWDVINRYNRKNQVKKLQTIIGL